jgi:hypothetical protein
MNSILINDDGTIGAISTLPNEYPLQCPAFITVSNFQEYKCVNLENYLQENKWIIIKPI